MSSAAQIAQWREDLEQLSSLRMRDSGDEYHDDDLAFIDRAYSSFFAAIEAVKMKAVTEHCENLINEIFAFQNVQDPDSDPGDIAIWLDIQDDSKVVTVRQNELVTYGDGIVHALTAHLARVTATKLSEQ